MKKQLYLLLSIVGIIVPYTQFIPYSQQYGFNLAEIFRQAGANYISTGIALDALLAAVVVIIWMISEQKTQRVRYLWISVIGMFAIGLSFALPFYLYLRELSKKNT